MVRKVITTLVDDVDGTLIDEGAGETIVFGLDGTTYEIDLTRANSARLRDALAPYISAGRAIRDRPAKPAFRATTSRRSAELAVIREWASANNYPAPSRGRIPATTIAAYESASKQAPAPRS